MIGSLLNLSFIIFLSKKALTCIMIDYLRVILTNCLSISLLVSSALAQSLLILSIISIHALVMLVVRDQRATPSNLLL